MFGLIHACRGTLDDDLYAQWQAHLCGLCLSLRDGSGQLSRVLTNTDAVLLPVLTEAQRDDSAKRTQAGRCALRGWQTAAVVPVGDVTVRLGATASLTLAAGKVADVVGERAYGLGVGGVRPRAAAALHRPLRRWALADHDMAAVLGVVDLLTDLAAQPSIEARTRPGDSLASVTAITARACGRVFVASARVAERPANEEPLRAVGEAFGGLAHLLDAVHDLEVDRRAGAFNPVLATSTPLDEVRRQCTSLVRIIRDGFDALTLPDPRLARTLLVDGAHRALHDAFDTDRRATAPAAMAVSRAGQASDVVVADGSVLSAAMADPGQQPHFRRKVLPWIGVYCTGYACCTEHPNPCTGRRHTAGWRRLDPCVGCECCDC